LLTANRISRSSSSTITHLTMISTCSTIKQSGVPITLRGITNRYVCTRITGRTIEGNLIDIFMIP
jgi:3D (Asp-Asp-Asp) domain-containing protein